MSGNKVTPYKRMGLSKASSVNTSFKSPVITGQQQEGALNDQINENLAVKSNSRRRLGLNVVIAGNKSDIDINYKENDSKTKRKRDDVSKICDDAPKNCETNVKRVKMILSHQNVPAKRNVSEDMYESDDDLKLSEVKKKNEKSESDLGRIESELRKENEKRAENVATGDKSKQKQNKAKKNKERDDVPKICEEQNVKRVKMIILSHPNVPAKRNVSEDMYESDDDLKLSEVKNKNEKSESDLGRIESESRKENEKRAENVTRDDKSKQKQNKSKKNKERDDVPKICDETPKICEENVKRVKMIILSHPNIPAKRNVSEDMCESDDDLKLSEVKNKNEKSDLGRIESELQTENEKRAENITRGDKSKQKQNKSKKNNEPTSNKDISSKTANKFEVPKKTNEIKDVNAKDSQLEQVSEKKLPKTTVLLKKCPKIEKHQEEFIQNKENETKNELNRNKSDDLYDSDDNINLCALIRKDEIKNSNEKSNKDDKKRKQIKENEKASKNTKEITENLNANNEDLNKLENTTNISIPKALNELINSPDDKKIEEQMKNTDLKVLDQSAINKATISIIERQLFDKTTEPTINVKEISNKLANSLNKNVANSQAEKSRKLKKTFSLKKSDNIESNASDGDDFLIYSSVFNKHKLKRIESSDSIGSLNEDELRDKVFKLSETVAAKVRELNDMKQAVIYKKRHSVVELEEETKRWKEGCKEAMEALLIKLNQSSSVTMEELMKQLNVPREMIDVENGLLL